MHVVVIPQGVAVGSLVNVIVGNTRRARAETPFRIRRIDLRVTIDPEAGTVGGRARTERTRTKVGQTDSIVAGVSAGAREGAVAVRTVANNGESTVIVVQIQGIRLRLPSACNGVCSGGNAGRASRLDRVESITAKTTGAVMTGTSLLELSTVERAERRRRRELGRETIRSTHCRRREPGKGATEDVAHGGDGRVERRLTDRAGITRAVSQPGGVLAVKRHSLRTSNVAPTSKGSGKLVKDLKAIRVQNTHRQHVREKLLHQLKSILDVGIAQVLPNCARLQNDVLIELLDVDQPLVDPEARATNVRTPTVSNHHQAAESRLGVLKPTEVRIIEPRRVRIPTDQRGIPTSLEIATIPHADFRSPRSTGGQVESGIVGLDLVIHDTRIRRRDGVTERIERIGVRIGTVGVPARGSDLETVRT